MLASPPFLAGATSVLSDELGFVSDKLTVELRSLGLRFATVLPDEAKGVSW